MKAAVGDRLVVHSVHVDGPVRDGEIVEVRGPDGVPPYEPPDMMSQSPLPELEPSVP